MEVVIASITWLVMPNCEAICLVAGATMDDDTGLMNVNADTINVAPHLRLYDQLRPHR